MRTFALAILVALAVPSAAAAKHRGPSFPSGNSAVNQYVEVVPTASGGKPSRNIHPTVGGGSSSSKGGGGGPTAVAPSTSAALSRSGALGKQAAAVAQATAPSGVQGAPAAGHGAAPTTGSGPTPPGAPSSGAIRPTSSITPPVHTKSASGQVLAALSGSTTHGGLGVLLPALLALAVVAGAVVVVRRRLRDVT
jgi:hypothetical protein